MRKGRMILVCTIIALIVGGVLFLIDNSKVEVVSSEPFTKKQIKEGMEFDKMLQEKDFYRKIGESLKDNGYEAVAMMASAPSDERVDIDIHLKNEPNNKIKKEIESIVKDVGKKLKIDSDAINIKIIKYEKPKNN
ncbi:hypothetical protein ABE29_22625 [Cytobacillus firmus]|uniref:hypothetical protein n=1 Tax=Cytobacillus firmus TaxID=1399 RepID=UPI00077C904B|nr:hypothetical protein [Cytobacillus firmus]MBG9545448.1 hypothetical protein [Cytobacillus firmus]MBG9554527.1 hypothetical protein [Cytobacillus firmus]MBG9555389.1 hypothetical protein [Cytobacillus firmus]MBG9576150.1 hypothetical protein [Cytobacillus firmus]MEC1894801.1 hypothetical protein [Cytobacillus firmus]